MTYRQMKREQRVRISREKTGNAPMADAAAKKGNSEKARSRGRWLGRKKQHSGGGVVTGGGRGGAWHQGGELQKKTQELNRRKTIGEKGAPSGPREKPSGTSSALVSGK